MKALTLFLILLFMEFSVNTVFAGQHINTSNENSGYLTGWHEIDENWYYFDEEGTMLRDAFTPDGWLVGTDGTWEHEEDYNSYMIMEKVYSKLNTQTESPVIITLDVDMTLEELDYLVLYMSYKYKYGILRNHSTIRYRYTGNIVKELYFQIDNPKQIENEIQACEKTIDLINTETEGMSIMEKMAFFNAHLVNNCNYYCGDNLKECFGASNALLNGQVLCNGYSSAFYFLCKEAGIYCEYVFGEAGSNNDYHVWNKVKVNGTTKYIDVTWNDSVSPKNRFFLLEPDMMPTHKPTGYRGVSSLISYQ